jgi:hypothetical protein
MGIKAIPDNDSINLGDTIWLDINEPATLTDAQSGKLIDYGGASNLGTAIGIAELISVNVTNTEGNSFFKFVLSSGSEVTRPDTNKFREYLFVEVNNRYVFKLGLIPQKRGVFKVFLSNAANVYRRNDRCSKANFTINFQDTDQHYYLNEVSFPGVLLSGSNGVYLFKVK